MGECAEYILNGDDCQVCGEYIGEGNGYPRACYGCGGNNAEYGGGKKARQKRRRQRKAQKRREILASANSEGWNKHTEWHWSKSLCGLKFDYWPSGKKAMFNGKVYKNVENVSHLEEALKEGFGK